MTADSLAIIANALVESGDIEGADAIVKIAEQHLSSTELDRFVDLTA